MNGDTLEERDAGRHSSRRGSFKASVDLLSQFAWPLLDKKSLFDTEGGWRVFQAVVRQISVPLWKLCLDDEGALLKKTIANPTFHPLGGQKGPFQFTFNGLLKVAFQGSHITSDAGLILVRELNERLGLEQRITDHLSDSRHGTNTQFRVADLLRQSVYSRLAGYEDLNDAVGAFSEERWRRKSTGMERCPRNAVEPRRFPSIPRRGVYRFCVPGAGRSATKKLVATGARWCSVGLFRTAKMEIPA